MILAKWVNKAALGLVAASAILFLLSFFTYMSVPSEPEMATCDVEKPPLEHILPSYFLPLKDEDYETIGPPLFQTRFTPITLQLPDLRAILFYYGINSRPDAKNDAIALQFGVGPAGGLTSAPNTLASIAPDTPLYLVYDRTQGAGKYLFSPNNQPTSLWILAEPQDNSSKVNVILQDEEGKHIQDPPARAEFTLPQKELSRSGPSNWFLGTLRVDGTLLARQKARWYGQDLFINDHGGSEYRNVVGKERIEFGEGQDRYFVYLGPDSCLIWKDQHWQPALSVTDSTSYPLLCVKKIEERLLRLELWDVDGKARMPLTLLRSTESWNPTQTQKEFVFVSPRTLSQYIFNIRKERVILRVHDWFLLTKEGWKKLVTPSQIDAYVDGNDPGILFIFEGPKDHAGVRVLSGILYNLTRSVKTEVEYPLEHGAKSAKQKDNKKKQAAAPPKNGQPNAQTQTKPKEDVNTSAPPPKQAPVRNEIQSRLFPESDDDDDEDDDDDDFDEAQGMWMDKETQETQKFFNELRH